MTLTLDDVRTVIRQVLKEEITHRLDSLETKVSNLEKQLLELTALKATVSKHETKIKEVAKSCEFSSNQISEIVDNKIPNLDKKFTELSTNMCLNILNLDTHRRKWTLIINGLHGNPGEPELETRNKVKHFAVNKLKVPGADSHLFSACHRLSQQANAGIIVRFNDLANRNDWLSGAGKLKNTGSKVSISPDLHPCLRKLKTDILNIRKKLPLEEKKTSQVKYLPSWPFVCLKSRGKPTIHPTIPKETIVRDYLSTQ